MLSLNNRFWIIAVAVAVAVMFVPCARAQSDCRGEEVIIAQPWDGVTGGVGAQVFRDFPDLSHGDVDDVVIITDRDTGMLVVPGIETGDMGANIDVVGEIWDGLPGAFGGRLVMSSVSGVESADGTLCIDFGGQFLPAGDYWITAYVVRPLDPGGEWFWRRTNEEFPNGSEHYYWNPGGAWGFGVDPIPGSIVYGTPADMSFVLHGCAVPACTWDLNGDDVVGAGDLIVLLGAWGKNPDHPADFNGDGVVGTSDLIELLGNWGPCP